MSKLLTSYDHLIRAKLVRCERNPIIRRSGVPGDWKEWQVEESFVFADPVDPTRLIMFYSGARPPDIGGAYVGVATADVSDPFRWIDYPSNPILSPGAGFYNDVYIRLDCVLYVDGVYWLYSTGMSPDHTDRNGQLVYGFNSIELAHSTDGLNFTWHEGPVLLPSEDELHVSQAAVLKEGSDWHMYYSYRTSSDILPGIRLATSADGIHWHKTGRQILSRSPAGYDSHYYEWHQILKLGADYVLLSECFDGVHWSVGAAHSVSPAEGWVKKETPLFERSGVPGAFDEHHVATPAIFDVGDRAMLFYQGGNNGGNYIMSNWDIGVACLDPEP